MLYALHNLFYAATSAHELTGSNPDYINRDEFALYDSFQVMGFIQIISFGLILMLGKIGVQAAWKQKAEFAKLAAKKGTCISALVGVLFILYLI